MIEAGRVVMLCLVRTLAYRWRRGSESCWHLWILSAPLQPQMMCRVRRHEMPPQQAAAPLLFCSSADPMAKDSRTRPAPCGGSFSIPPLVPVGRLGREGLEFVAATGAANWHAAQSAFGSHGRSWHGHRIAPAIVSGGKSRTGSEVVLGRFVRLSSMAATCRISLVPFSAAFVHLQGSSVPLRTTTPCSWPPRYLVARCTKCVAPLSNRV